MSCLFFNPTDGFLYAGNKCAIFVDIVRLKGAQMIHVLHNEKPCWKTRRPDFYQWQYQCLPWSGKIYRLTVIVLGIDSTHVIMPFSLNTFKCDATDDVDLFPVRSQISLTVGGKPWICLYRMIASNTLLCFSLNFCSCIFLPPMQIPHTPVFTGRTVPML